MGYSLNTYRFSELLTTAHVGTRHAPVKGRLIKSTSHSNVMPILVAAQCY